MPTLSIRTRLLALVSLFVIALVLLAAFDLVGARQSRFDERRLKTQHLAQAARSVVQRFHAQETAGQLTREQAQAGAKETLLAMRYDGKEYFWINDMQPRLLIHPYLPQLVNVDLGAQANKSLLPLFTAFADVVRKSGEGFHDYVWPKAGATDGVLYPKTSYVAGFEPWGWVIGTGIYVDDVEAAFWQEVKSRGLVILPVILLLSFAGWHIARGITRPIGRTTTALEKLAAGDSDVELEQTDTRDEIGRMTHAAVRLKDVVVHAFTQARIIEELPTPVMTATAAGGLKVEYANRAAAELMRELKISPETMLHAPVGQLHPELAGAQGALSQATNLPWTRNLTFGDRLLQVKATAILDKTGRYLGPMLAWTDLTRQEQLAQRFETTVSRSVGEMDGLLRTIAEKAGGMRSSSDAALGRAASVAASAEQASVNVQTVAAATEELASSIREITRQIEQSNRMASEAVKISEATNEHAATLAEAVNRIGAVTQMIEAIAAQTNLLALNATIEAARAGEAGKGFAVVAGEVKSLATQTAKATGEIATQISEVQRTSHETATGIDTAMSKIREMSGVFAAVAAAVEEQHAATLEISRNVQEAARGTQDVSSMIGEVRDASSKVGEQAEAVDQAPMNGTRTASAMGEAVREFLGFVRAA